MNSINFTRRCWTLVPNTYVGTRLRTPLKTASVAQRFCKTFFSTIIKNESIGHPSLRVILDKVENEDDPKWKIMSKEEALAYAKSAGLDLILVNETISPPVCKLGKAAKIEMENKRAEGEQRAKLRAQSMKEMTIGAMIAPNDLQHKTTRICEFLDSGHPVRMFITIKAAEKSKDPTALNSAVVKIASTVEKHCGGVQELKGSFLRREFLLTPKGKKK
jgi:translation initiation factor IF-3